MCLLCAEIVQSENAAAAERPKRLSCCESNKRVAHSYLSNVCVGLTEKLQIITFFFFALLLASPKSSYPECHLPLGMAMAMSK